MIVMSLGSRPPKHPMKARKAMLFFKKNFRIILRSKMALAGRVTIAALALVAFVIFTHSAVAGSHPNMYLNQAEIDAINSKVSGNVEPWSSAYSRVLSAANSALNKPLLSVTLQGKTNSQYFTEKPYCGWPKPNVCRDGQINPNADRGDYIAAIELGDVVRDLGLAYAFTGEAKYADKAIDFIRAWSLDPGTRMKPTTAAGNRIELFITLPGYFYGADLIWSYDGWDADEKAAFAGWVKALGDHAMSNGVGLNNFANWRVVLIASIGALLNDNSFLSFAENEWKRLLPLQMNGVGSSVAGILGQESGRTRGLHYSLYAINAMIQGAEILRHHNVNLYDVVVKGRSLKLALDFITPYAINPSQWTADRYKQITTITQNDSMALFELAYSYYQEPSYLDVINKWKRPMEETRVMGINTLTHANRFDLSTVSTAPSIIVSPDDVTVAEGEDASFSVAVIGSDPLSYQWFRDGVAIAGATNASYTLTGVSSSDSGSVYSCDVSNSLGSVSSRGGVLTVLSDSIAPTLVSAVATSDTRVDIFFSEAISASSAENSANYQVDLGITVTSATLNGDGRTVSLIVSQLTEETIYTVQASNVQDLAQPPNTMTAQSSQTFTYRTADGFENGTADGWISLTSANWDVVMDEGDMAYYLKPTGFASPGNGRLGEYSLLSAEYGDFTFTAQAKLGADINTNANADYVVVFGFQDADNYYYAMFNNNQNYTQLFKVVNGVRNAALATADSDWLTDNVYHSIKVSRVGSEIEVYFNDNLILSANDSTFGAGKVGIGGYNDAAYFDEVSVVAGVTTGGSGSDSDSGSGFENGTADGWSSLTSGNWEVVMDEGDMAYFLKPGFASPGNGRLGEYSLLSAEYGDFTFTAEAKLGADVNTNANADYVVVFGFQDADNYYYAMFNNNQNYTQLFKVVNGVRNAALATADSDWLTDNIYHSIKVSRVGSEIEVYFDDNLILSANDSTFGTGKVGVGGYNDAAYFDEVSM